MPDISIQAADGSGSFSAYCAMPKSGSSPGIVVLQEIFGVNQVMRDLCDGYCLGGSLAYATACFTDADACSGYYPVQIEDSLEMAATIKNTLTLHVAELDGFCPPEPRKRSRPHLAAMHTSRCIPIRVSITRLPGSAATISTSMPRRRQTTARQTCFGRSSDPDNPDNPGAPARHLQNFHGTDMGSARRYWNNMARKSPTLDQKRKRTCLKQLSSKKRARHRS